MTLIWIAAGLAVLVGIVMIVGMGLDNFRPKGG